MASPVLGIDLGTTNSVVAAAESGSVRVLTDEEGNRLFPSVVSFHPSGDVLTGYPARERRLLDAQNTIYSVKRLIGRPFRSEEVRRAKERFPFGFEEGPTGGALVVARGETYTLPEISAFVLREVRALAEDALKTACRRAVITVPANFNELQRSATKAAGRVAGLEVLRIINEPTAAALAYGCGAGKQRERIAVYDLGGGTFDITILELAQDVYEVISTAGDTFLGGDDIDVTVADEMASAFLQAHRYDVRADAQAYERLRAAAEWAKCQLSTAPDVELRVEELAYGPGGEALDLDFHMTRQRLESLCQPLVARTFDVCEEAMRLANMRPSQLDTVILVGGGTRIPLVRRMVQEYFGLEPLSSIDPDLVVAQGAAIQGAALSAAPVSSRARKASVIGRVALKRAKRQTYEEVPAGPAFQPDNRVERAPAPKRVGTPAAGAPAAADELEELQLDDILEDTGTSPVIDMGDVSAMDLSAPVFTDEPSTSTLAPPPDLMIPDAGAPLLLDVTPHSLAIETVAGFCEVVIARNAAIPVEQSRLFSTSQDYQESVEVRVCQGESRKLEENEILGVLALHGLRPAPRGAAQIDVVFVLDADGTLRVRATDRETGQAQAIEVLLVGGIDEGEVERMRARQAAMVEAGGEAAG